MSIEKKVKHISSLKDCDNLEVGAIIQVLRNQEYVLSLDKTKVVTLRFANGYVEKSFYDKTNLFPFKTNRVLRTCIEQNNLDSLSQNALKQYKFYLGLLRENGLDNVERYVL